MSRYVAAALSAALAANASAQCIIHVNPPLIVSPSPSQGGLFGSSIAADDDTAMIGTDPSGGYGPVDIFEFAGGTWHHAGQLTHGASLIDQQFGYEIAISGQRALIAAPNSLSGLPGEGAAYFYQRNAGTWQEVAMFESDPNGPADNFASSVSLDNTTAIVGAWADRDAGHITGAAYIFEETAGTWTQHTKLYASDPDSNDRFGVSVSIQGQTALVGAYRDDQAAANAGAAYIFRQTNGTWQQIAKLTASDATPDAEFGSHVYLAGEFAFISATHPLGYGLVYIFEEIAGTWTQVDTLSAPGATSIDAFGTAIVQRDAQLLIGARGASTDGPHGGKAFAYRRIAGTWELQARLQPEDADLGDDFGAALALTPYGALFGAPTAEFDDLSFAGTVMTFPIQSDCNANLIIDACELEGADCNQNGIPDVCDIASAASEDCNANGLPDECETVFSFSNRISAPDARKGAWFGSGLAIDAATIVVGATESTATSGDTSGAAHIYERTGQTWMHTQTLRASDAAPGAAFGNRVAMHADTLVIGARSDDDAGAAYVFQRSTGIWNELVKLTAFDAQPGASFGRDVAIAGDTIVVSAPNHAEGIGTAYVFHRVGPDWELQTQLSPQNPETEYAYALNLALAGDLLAVTALTQTDETSGVICHVYRRTAGTWQFESTLTPWLDVTQPILGSDVATDGDQIIIGLGFDDTLVRDAGAAYIYRYVQNAWSKPTQILAPDGSMFDIFGSSVAIQGQHAIIAAVNDDDAGASSGSAYLFRELNAQWIPVTKLFSPDIEAEDSFGSAIALAGDQFVISATGDDHAGLSTGAAYAFQLPVDTDCDADGTPDECETDDNANGIPDDCEPCPADWNNDTIFNTADFVAYLGDFNIALAGGDPTYANPDIREPIGVLNTADFVEYLNRFTTGCP